LDIQAFQDQKDINLNLNSITMSSWSYFYSTQVFKQDFKTIGGTAIGDRDEVEYELKISLYLVYQYQLKQKRTEFAYTQQRNGKEYGFSCILM